MSKRRRYIIGFAATAVLLIVLFAAGLYTGSAGLSFAEVTDVLTLRSDNITAVNIVYGIRLPRAAAAVILGGGLSVSGYLLQTFFANPIAGPYVLGISSGAKLTVAFAMIFALREGFALNSAGMIAAAFVGAMISMGFVLMISGKVKKSSVLIISGVMIGYICSALTDFAVTFADDSNIVNLHNWSMGSFSGIDSDDVKAMSAVIFPSVLAALLMSKQISAYRLGETYARSSGVDIRLFRALLILLSSLLSAAVTAFAGPVSFVGIAVPQLMKSITGTSKPQIMIPASFLGGAAFCLLCDIIARTAFAPSELSISTVTAVFGAPVVIWIMLKKNSHAG
ncbi:MAG: FecCD family ABC transporter permease [Oscillospiraceae bacterium]